MTIKEKIVTVSRWLVEDHLETDVIRACERVTQQLMGWNICDDIEVVTRWEEMGVQEEDLHSSLGGENAY